MKTSTTIRKVLADNLIFVPEYQRAYSWDTENDSSKPPKQVNTFLSDIESHRLSKTKSKYYFGHFLFEEKTENRYGIIDGQQRLTTIVIFLSVLFRLLEIKKPLPNNLQSLKEDMIVKGTIHRFETVSYDKLFFKDYVINSTRKDSNGLKTKSSERIVDAYSFFYNYLLDKDEDYILEILEIIQKSYCSTHIINEESEAIQMFIFQNNRGKKPSNLEIIKAQFMFNIHLNGGKESSFLIDEIKDRFANIYESLSSIEHVVKEDAVLLYTLRVHFNSLRETNALNKIQKELLKENSINFIRSFTQSLDICFRKLQQFYIYDEKENIEIHSIITLGRIGVILPFIIKAYKFGLTLNQIKTLCRSFETIIFRHRVIRTRADITSRLNDVYKNFTLDNPDIVPIIEKIESLKTVKSNNWWLSYWNNEKLINSLQGKIDSTTAKYILWKYELFLKREIIQSYKELRYDKIIYPELEHIAPKTENPETGYDKYDDEFKSTYLDCLGNYILLPRRENRSIGNKPFIEKLNSYNELAQQREIRKMTAEGDKWTRKLIQKRKDKIIKFILKEF